MRERVLFIYNPKSGQEKIKPVLSDIVDIIIKANFEVEIYATQSTKDALHKVEEAVGTYDRIVVSGGDGTLDEVVTGLMRSGVSVPVGYLPAGSANDFGNSLGIGLNLIESAKKAVLGKVFKCDIGCFNSDYFVYVAAFGLFTEASYTTSQELKNMLGYVAYVLEGAKQLVDIPSYEAKIACDGEELSGSFMVGLVTNADYIGGVRGLIARDVMLDDGLFEITLVRTPKNPLELTEIIGFFSNITSETHMVYSTKAHKVNFQFKDAVPWTLDGEFGGDHKEVEIKNLPKAIQILV